MRFDPICLEIESRRLTISSSEISSQTVLQCWAVIVCVLTLALSFPDPITLPRLVKTRRQAWKASSARQCSISQKPRSRCWLMCNRRWNPGTNPHLVWCLHNRVRGWSAISLSDISGDQALMFLPCHSIASAIRMALPHLVSASGPEGARRQCRRAIMIQSERHRTG
jgi:hypothetical protein